MKKRFLALMFLIVATACSAQTYSIRKEFRRSCEGGKEFLVGTEYYSSKGLLSKSTREDRKRSTEYVYDDAGKIIVKIHRDSTGKVTRFNKISYSNGKLLCDTLFNADSTVNMIFSSRFSSSKKEQKIFWIDPAKNTYINTQTILTDSLGNEIENKSCSSNSECMVYRTEYSNGKKSSMKIYTTDEMVRKMIPYQTETYEYDASGRLIKTTLTDATTESCLYVLTYHYE